jgi:hypothetical protein
MPKQQEEGPCIYNFMLSVPVTHRCPDPSKLFYQLRKIHYLNNQILPFINLALSDAKEGGHQEAVNVTFLIL